jgi:spore coat protein CotH
MLRQDGHSWSNVRSRRSGPVTAGLIDDDFGDFVMTDTAVLRFCGLRTRAALMLILLLGLGANAHAAAICGETIFTDGYDAPSAPAPCLTSQAFFDDSQVREIRLVFTDPNWYQTLYDAHANDDTDPSFPASFESQGVQFAKVGVRMKGFSSFAYPGTKKSFKIDFNYYDPPGTPGSLETAFYGLKKLNLNNSVYDPTMLREKLFMDFARKFVPSAVRIVHCRLYINGAYYGLYAAVEQVDKVLLKSRYGSGDDGNLWKGAAPDDVSDPSADFGSDLTWLGTSPTPYYEDYQLKTNEEENDYSGLIEFIDVLNNTPTAALPAAFEPIADVPDILAGLAVSNLFAHLDSYTGSAHNYYLYDRSDNGRMTHMLWDANMSFGRFRFGAGGDLRLLSPLYVPTPTASQPRPLLTKLWAVPEYKQRYLRDIAQMLRSGFDTASMQAEIDRLAALIRPDVSADPRKFYTLQQFNDNLYSDIFASQTIFGLRAFVTARAAHLETQLNTFALKSDIRLNEAMPVNVSTVQDGNGEYDPWLELYNLGPGLVDLSGLYLTDDPANPTRWPLPAATLDDGKFLTIWMDGQTAQGANHANFALSPTGGTLYLYQSPATLIDTIIYPAQLPDRAYARVPDGEGAWASTNRATPGAANLAATATAPPVLFINELMADNTTIPDPDEPGAFEDWIEIYNPNDTTVDLGGLHLTDTLASPTLWTFPAGVTIAPHGFLVVWADDEGAQGPTHAAFKLSKSGESVGLYSADGTIAIDTITFGQQTTNVSFGRSVDGAGTWGARPTPTPGATNTP